MLLQVLQATCEQTHTQTEGIHTVGKKQSFDFGSFFKITREIIQVGQM